MKKISITTTISETNSLNDLGIEDQEIISLALSAAGASWSPYSRFAVGAALRLANGVIVTGTNVENAAFPSGICAEHTALSTAASSYPEIAPVAMAITALNKGKQVVTPVAPCGKCRQVIAETENRYKRDIKLFLVGQNKVTIIERGCDLLPLVFSQRDLSSSDE
nr:cytidine deaminase [uncultured bacterium]